MQNLKISSGSMSKFFEIYKPLKIENPNGDIFRVLRNDEKSFDGFGEAYLSSVHQNSIKAWKMHNKMIMNLVVPIGQVGFVFTDGAEFESIVIGELNYLRLVVQPGIWFGFKGISKNQSLILNIANILHSDSEVDRKEVNSFSFEWSKL